MSTWTSFPLETLPDQVRVFIKQLAERQSLNADFLATTFLGIGSACCGRKIVVRVSSTHLEHPILWLPLVGNSASKKSAAMKIMLRPMDELEVEYDVIYKQKLSEWKSQSGSESKGPYPRSQQCKLDDLTLEALADVADFNHTGLLMIKDELMSWIKESTRYTGGNGKGDEERWLSLHDGRSIRINRKNNENNRLVQNPFVSVIGGIQPGILPSLITKDRLNNGFTNRLLFCFPDLSDQYVATVEVDEGILRDYHEFVKKLWKMEVSKDEHGSFVTVDLALSSKAKELYDNWRTKFSLPIINSPNPEDSDKGYVSKLEGAILRIAGILEYCWSETVPSDPISPVNMERAVLLGKYFYQNWQKVRETLSNVEGDKSGNHLNLVVQALHKQQTDFKTIAQFLRKNDLGNNEVARILSLSKSTISTWCGGNQG